MNCSSTTNLVTNLKLLSQHFDMTDCDQGLVILHRSTTFSSPRERMWLSLWYQIFFIIKYKMQSLRFVWFEFMKVVKIRIYFKKMDFILFSLIWQFYYSCFFQSFNILSTEVAHDQQKNPFNRTHQEPFIAFTFLNFDKVHNSGYFSNFR